MPASEIILLVLPATSLLSAVSTLSSCTSTLRSLHPALLLISVSRIGVLWLFMLIIKVNWPHYSVHIRVSFFPGRCWLEADVATSLTRLATCNFLLRIVCRHVFYFFFTVHRCCCCFLTNIFLSHILLFFFLFTDLFPCPPSPFFSYITIFVNLLA